VTLFNGIFYFFFIYSFIYAGLGRLLESVL
jgi:hypothetical protein